MQQTAIIQALYRYPLKGFSGEALAGADLKAGETIPYDRAFAIENGASGFDAATPSYLPKIRFLMLMRNEHIAKLSSRFDPQSGVLTIGNGELEISGCLFDAQGRRIIEDWIAEEFATELRGPPCILSANGHSFSDKKQKVLHLINLASVRKLEEQMGRHIDPVRFRANIVIDGAPPFSELDWVGKSLRLPNSVLSVADRTERCAATNVDPATGARDMQLPRQLMGLYGHTDFGIYLNVENSGRIARGDALSVTDETSRPL